MSDNKLLNAVKMDDLKYLSLLVNDGDYLKEHLQELFDYFTFLGDKHIYIQKRINKLQKCVDILMPVMYDFPSNWGESFASWVVSLGIIKGDCKLFNEGFAYLAIDESKNDFSSSGGSSIIEDAVLSYSREKMAKMPQIKEMIKKMSEKQMDNDGLALLRCVQRDYPDLFDIILPHSNIASENYFVYYYACGLENTYYMDKLKPLVDEVQALYGVKYKLPYAPRGKEKEQLNKAKKAIFESIEQNPDNKNKKLLLKIHHEDTDGVVSYIKKNKFSNNELMKMLEFSWDTNEKTYIKLLDFIQPGSMEYFDINKLMVRNMDKFKIHVKPYDRKTKENLFFNAAYFNNKEAMFYFIENEFTRSEIMDIVSSWEWKYRGVGNAFHTGLKLKAAKPYDNLKNYLIEYDRDCLKQNIISKNEQKKDKKI